MQGGSLQADPRESSCLARQNSLSARSERLHLPLNVVTIMVTNRLVITHVTAGLKIPTYLHDLRPRKPVHYDVVVSAPAASHLCGIANCSGMRCVAGAERG